MDHRPRSAGRRAALARRRGAEGLAGLALQQPLLQDRLDRDLTHATGISHAYYEILVALSEAPGRMMRMSELADRCLSSRSRLSHAVSRLEERGWVRRQVCAEDGRGQLAVLTDEGFAALEAAAPVHVESVRTHLFDQLSPRQVAAHARHRRDPAPPPRPAVLTLRAG